MTDNINKKITIEVDVNTDGQQKISLYKTAITNLQNAIRELDNPLTDLSTNIKSLDADISKFANSGNNAKSKVDDLASSFVNWTSVIKLLTRRLGGWGVALSAGISIITTYGSGILRWISSLTQGDETLTSLNKTLRDNKTVMDAVNRTMLDGEKNAQQELVNLKLLYSMSQNHNLSLKERKKAVNELIDSFPKYFKNGSFDVILTGKAAKSYNDLANAIVASSKARKAKDDIVKNQKEQLEHESNITKEIARQVQLKKNLKSLKAELDKAFEGTNEYNPRSNTLDSPKASTTLQAKINNLQNQLTKSTKTSDDLKNKKDLLLKKNDALTKSINGITETYGVDILNGVNHEKSKNSDSNSDTTVALAEMEQIFRDSRMRQLQMVYEAYGNETVAETTHYQEQLDRTKLLFTKKLITKKEFVKVSGQLEQEHKANIASIIKKYNNQDKERTQQAATELEELKINAMQDGAEKQKAQRDFQQKQALLQIDKADEELRARAKKLSVELANILMVNPLADTSAIAGQLTAINAIIDTNKQKRSLIESTGAKNADKEKADVADQEKLKKLKEKVDEDTKSVDSAKTSGAKFKAEKALIDDKFQYDLAQAGNNAEKKKELETKHQKDITEITKKAEQERKDFAFKIAEQLSAAAFSLVTANIKYQSEAKIAGLEKDKTNELSNSSLTSAQKLVIENKYKKQEAAIKVKAFKDEQKASIAQALINGAIAITKAEAQTGVLGTFVIPGIIAETAIQVAKIASQKPPAYAHGGLHYQSDGRGGVLPGYSRTDNTNAYLRSGEGVVVSEAMQVPWARNLVSAINVGFGGRDFSITNPGRGYAVGGIFTDGGDANRYYNQPVNDQKNLANSIAYQMINNFPPVYVDVKDINNQQNILAQTVNRVNL